MSEIEIPNGPIDSKALKRQVSQLKGEDKWKDIADLVKRWERKSPQYAQMTQAYVKDVRDGLHDKKFGTTQKNASRGIQSGGVRIGIAIHPELMNFIQAFYPDFLDNNEDVAQFKKRFPQYRISEAS